MLGGRLRISPALPGAWKMLRYVINWKDQRLDVTVTRDALHIENVTGGSPVTLEVWGREYTFDSSLTADRE